MQEKLRKFFYNFNNYKNNLIKRHKCPLCNHKKKKIWSKYNKIFTALQCTSCKFVYIDKILNSEALNNYYKNYINFRISNKKKTLQRSKMYEIDTNYLKLYKKKGSLLDIGCSDGSFTKVLGKHYDAIGVDIDKDAIKLAKKKANNKFYNIDINADYKILFKKKFDIIVMRGVIEHVTEPNKYIKTVSQLLKKNGIFFISATPNINSPAAQIFRSKWNQFDPIQHINIFSEKTLTKACKKFSLFLENAHYPYLNTPYENFVKDLKNFKSSNKVSPPFWGTMMTLIYKKR